LEGRASLGMGRLVVAAAVAVWAFPIAAMVNSVVPEPYMVSSFSSILSTLSLLSVLLVSAVSSGCNGLLRMEANT
jgi:hypothetical protein